MSDINTQQYRSYNDFSNKAIYTAQGIPSAPNTSWTGWRDEYIGDTVSTPITAENLNAMLNMLIYIRNVIGKTDDFATEINGITNIPQPDSNLTVDDQGNRADQTIAKYIKQVVDAIIGSGDDTTNETITRTLSGLKHYLESLDVSNESNEDDINNSGDHKWVNKVTQVNGLIDIEYAQPDASNISYNDPEKGPNLTSSTTVNNALNILDDIIGNLSEIKYSNVPVNSVSEALEKERTARINTDNELDRKISDEISNRTNAVNSVSEALEKEIGDRQIADEALLGTGPTDTDSTIKKNEAAIAVINNSETGILAQSKNYTDSQIKALDFTDTEVAKEFVTSVSRTDGKISIARKALVEADIPTLNVSKISGLDDKLLSLQAKVFTGTSLEDISEQKNNDIAIISSNISNDKYSKTAYIWDQALNNNAGAWVAFDGNYNAKSVYFDENIILAGDYTQVGNLKKDKSGTINLESAGKNLYEVMQSIFTKEIKPGDTGYAIDLPSAEISVSGSSDEVEVGNTFTLPTATLKITDVGSYPFEPKATGITFPAESVTLSQGGNTAKNSAALGANGTVTLQATGTNTTYGDSDVSFTFTGTAAYSASTVTPKTNLGNEYAAKKIAAGSCTVSSQTAKFKGYRKWFYGGDTKTDFASDTIRALTNSSAAVSSQTFELKAASYSGCSRIVIAIPANGGKVLKEVLLKSSSNADITGEFKQINTAENVINVAGYNGYTPISYNVWEYKPAALDSTEVYTIKID